MQIQLNYTHLVYRQVRTADLSNFSYMITNKLNNLQFSAIKKIEARQEILFFLLRVLCLCRALSNDVLVL